MTFRIALAGLAVLTAATPPAAAQAPDARPPRTPLDRFRAARDLIADGRFEVAAEELKGLLATAPSDRDIFAIQDRYGPAAFDRLRRVERWSDDPAAQADAQRAVDALIDRARQAARNFYRDPARIRRLVANLGGTPEERAYAVQQLRAAGDAAVRPVFDELRTAQSDDVRQGALEAVRGLSPAAVAGFLAGLDGLPDDLRAGVLAAVADRPDVLALTADADTDPRPWLWFYSHPGGQAGSTLKATAGRLLDGLVGGVARKAADAELVALARPLADGTARFAGLDRASDAVKLWAWDAGGQKLVDAAVPPRRAAEHLGLRNLRWALAVDPNNPVARDLALNLAVGRAVERAGFGRLATADPAAYRLAAAASTRQLLRNLDAALATDRPAEAVGFAQLLADRADPESAAPTATAPPNGAEVLKPSPLVRALDYPDPRVQLSAALALVRMPGRPTHGRPARVVEVLARALAAADPAPADGGQARGKALIADPAPARAVRLARYLAAAGYDAERLANGRELFARIRRAADFDLIVVDRHVAAPAVGDLLAQVRADVNAAGRPVLVVASPDVPPPPPAEHLLLRLAILVAASESAVPAVDPPFAIDPRLVTQRDPAAVARTRDGQLAAIAADRRARLERLVAAADLPPVDGLADRLALRLPQLTYAVLAAEYPVTEASAPQAFGELQSLTRRVRARVELNRAVAGLPTDKLSALTEQVESALDQPRRDRTDAIRRRLDPAALGLPPDAFRDPAAEARLARLAAGHPRVTVVPEPYGAFGFLADVTAATADPAVQPRSPADRRASARLALEGLRRAATGEVPGYDVRPAEPALRAALADPEFADAAVDAVAHLPTAAAQQDLVAVAVTTPRPVELRRKAADAAIRHAQRFGKLVPADQAAAVDAAAKAEADAAVRAQLVALRQLLLGTPDDFPALLQSYAPPLVDAPPPAPAAAPAP